MIPSLRATLAGTACLAAAALASTSGLPALAQPASPQNAAPAPQPATIELTQAQIDGLVAAQSELAKIQTSDQGKPDPKIAEQVEAIARKAGFANSDELGAAGDTVEAVLDGIDPETKSYVGATALIRKQIAEVEADKSLSAKDKAVALKELKDALAAGDARKPSPGNITLVSKNFDRLSQLQSEP